MSVITIVGALIFGAIVLSAVAGYLRQVLSFRVMGTFRGAFPADAEFDRPEGCYLARKLQSSLCSLASGQVEFDNWKDVGWVVTCSVRDSPLAIYFAHYSARRAWELTIESRSFGPSRYSSAMRELTLHVHALLREEPGVSAIRWALNRAPRGKGPADPATLSWPDHSDKVIE